MPKKRNASGALTTKPFGIIKTRFTGVGKENWSTIGFTGGVTWLGSV